MRQVSIAITTLILGIGIGVSLLAFTQKTNRQPKTLQTLQDFSTEQPKPLLAFTFENLMTRNYKSSKINLTEELEDTEVFTSYLFTYISDDKKVSGLANIPKSDNNNNKSFPVIIMIRGYVDKNNYETGIGTKRASKILAENGFITLSPDFLGYGKSDMPENDVWWERFNRPVQILNLLESVNTIPKADTSKIGIWAHSNGGQIALSVLEITKKNIPTTLWAPVSKPFPYSILYYTDEFEDKGKNLRAQIAKLDQDYDVNKYSIDNYFQHINTSIQIHQGTKDDAVPIKWSNDLVEKLKEYNINTDYFIYENADHNMKGSWDIVIKRDIEFFREKLGS